MFIFGYKIKTIKHTKFKKLHFNLDYLQMYIINI